MMVGAAETTVPLERPFELDPFDRPRPAGVCRLSIRRVTGFRQSLCSSPAKTSTRPLRMFRDRRRSRTDGTYNIGPAFYGMQSGTGTFDVLPRVLYAGTIAPWSWGVSYRARLPLAVNNEGYMWGHYQEANIWGGYSWIPGLTTTVRANFDFGVGNNGLVGYIDMRLVWAAGGGLEWMLSPSWSVKTEYLRYDLGTANTANIGPLYYADKAGLSSVAWKAPFNGNVVRAGLNYDL